ncbi:MAG: hypothetical protein J5794_05270 [Lachnospiraceae bacterium]|nr:hypothetical protein [Lachnospiraceae bacterium]
MSEVLTALWAKDGQEHSLSIKEWSELTGLDAATIRQRISTARIRWRR